MISAVIKKEFLSGLKTPRFIITALLSLTLLPLATYVNLRDYQDRSHYYQEALLEYGRASEVSYPLEGPSSEGFRPPNPYSVLVGGLDHIIPTHVKFLPEGVHILSGSQAMDNPLPSLAGHLDVAAVCGTVLSLLALLFVYRMIPGDRNSAALRIELSTLVTRDELLLGKLIGNYTLFCVPILVGFGGTAGTLMAFGLASEPEMLPRLAILFTLTLLFILVVFSLGAFVSLFTRRAAPSLAALLVMWVAMALVIPRLAPVVAEALHPVKPRELVEIEKSQTLAGLHEELDSLKHLSFVALMDHYKVEPEYHHYISIGWLPPHAQIAWILYNRNAKTLGRKYVTMLKVSYIKAEAEYARHYRSREELAISLARLSPVSCYGFAASSAAGTGQDAWLRIVEQDEWYARHVNEIRFSEIGFLRVGLRAALANYLVSPGDTQDPPESADEIFANPTLAESAQAAGPDVVFLALFALASTLAGLIRFRSYDVR